jgi:primosomal protein N' (replication factor Y)
MSRQDKNRSLRPENLQQVSVALPVPLRKTFSYLIPDDLDPETILEGRRILVPFGPRIMFGVTWSRPQPFTDWDHVHKYRYLIHYESDIQILSDEIRSLIQWMESYYLSPVGELLKCCLPPGVLEQKDPLYSVTAKGKRVLAQKGESTELVHILDDGLTRKAWSLRHGSNVTMKQIRAWERKGIIRPHFPGTLTPSTPRIPVIRLTETGRSLDVLKLKRTPRRSEILGFLQKQNSDYPVDSLKQIFPTASNHLKKLADSEFLRIIMRERHEFELQETSPFGSRPELRPSQQKALELLSGALQAGEYKAFLLFGITGSGKTEVYLRAIEECLNQGKQALLLVPEIALTPLMKTRILQRFGKRLAILHSAIALKERKENWSRVLAGKVDLVLGARSGIFAPLPRLGLIIVDEEHDSSYKQGDGPRYHARDLALVRAKASRAVTVLGSATPSLESWKNARDGKFQLIEMMQRATQALLPEVDIVNMREEFQAQRRRPVFSRTLVRHMKTALEQNEQIMLLLNRRGFHNFLLCRKCGYSLECEHCEVTMTYHKKEHFMKCHYCDSTCPVPTKCPCCDAEGVLLQFFGEGTQLIMEQAGNLFPDAVIDRLDRDRLTRRDALESILDKFREGRTQILIGTQMIAKGHDFHNVTLVGILNADQGLRIPDFRCAENTFQLLTQVAGRSGRGKKSGRVVIQTYMPEHYSIQSAKKHDFVAFSERELVFREGMFYPPYSFLFNMIFQSRHEQSAREAGHNLLERIQLSQKRGELQILGPVKAGVGKIKNMYRFQILVKAGSRRMLNDFAKRALYYLKDTATFKDVEVFFDMDPIQFT